MDTGKLSYEDAAVGPVVVDGLDKPLWWCVKCQRVYVGWEHGARGCCANDSPCSEDGCGERVIGRTRFNKCDPCTEKGKDARWFALEKSSRPSFPCFEWNGDRFFYDECQLGDWMEDEGIATMRLQGCVRSGVPEFEINEWLQDYLPEDLDADSSHDEEINRLIRDAAPEVWDPCGGEHFEYTVTASDKEAN